MLSKRNGKAINEKKHDAKVGTYKHYMSFCGNLINAYIPSSSSFLSRLKAFIFVPILLLFFSTNTRTRHLASGDDVGHYSSACLTMARQDGAPVRRGRRRVASANQRAAIIARIRPPRAHAQTRRSTRTVADLRIFREPAISVARDSARLFERGRRAKKLFLSSHL